MESSKIQHQFVGYALLSVVLLLFSIGAVMLFSVSEKLILNNPLNFANPVKKQFIAIFLGICIAVFFSKVDYHKVIRYSWVYIAISVVLLLLCFEPHLGKRINGANRWIELAGWTFQPSEFAKWSVACFFAFWMGKNQRRLKNIWHGFLTPLLVAGGLAFLVINEPDWGYASMIMCLAVVGLFAGGTKVSYVLPIPFLGLVGIITMAIFDEERRARILAFLDPEKYKDSEGFQAVCSQIALGSGGLWGVGLGGSTQKYYIPESTTDFIFPIIGEEMGMCVALLIVFAFVIFVFCGVWIAFYAPDIEGFVLGASLVTMIGLQALVNLGVVTGLIPNKGMPLPFMSSGGSNLILCMASVGLLFNLQKQAYLEKEESYETKRPFSQTVRM